MTAAIENERRFTQWYETYYPRVSAYVRRRLPEAHVADAVAEVFLVAWRRREDVPADRTLPWLYGVARRTVANARRSHDRSQHLLETLRQELPFEAPDHAVEVSSRLAMARAFGRLGDDEQEILRLAMWEELTPREGAQVLSCAATAYTMRLHRARKKLRRLLKEEAEPDRGGLGARSGRGTGSVTYTGSSS